MSSRMRFYSGIMALRVGTSKYVNASTFSVLMEPVAVTVAAFERPVDASHRAVVELLVERVVGAIISAVGVLRRDVWSSGFQHHRPPPEALQPSGAIRDAGMTFPRPTIPRPACTGRG